jgi:hypothetical protein
MMRFAFQRRREGVMKGGAIEKQCPNETGLPLRYAPDAVHDAQALITRRHQALQAALT